MFNRHDISRDAFMLRGPLARCGYDWWWHSFTAQDAETGEDKAFFIEYFVCNPALAETGLLSDATGSPGDGGLSSDAAGVPGDGAVSSDYLANRTEESKSVPSAGKKYAPVLGQLPENQAAGRRPSYMMVKAGCWGEEHFQLHRFFSLKDVEIHADAPYEIRADGGECYASETLLRGCVTVSPEEAEAHPEWMCDGGSISWELSVDKKIAFNVGYGAGSLLRTVQAFAMYWHAEGMKTAYSGTVRCNGREYVVTPERCFGYADKNWGRDFTSPWVWLSSNCLTSRKTGRRLENSVFDIGGGRPKIYFVPLDRRLLGVFYYEGREFDFNFSHFWLGVRTEFSFEELDDRVHWHVRQENRYAVMESEIYCLKREMVMVNYEAPDGRKRHRRLWNGGTGWGVIKLYEKEKAAGGSDEGATGQGEKAGRGRDGYAGLRLIDEIDATHIGCEYGEYDVEEPYRVVK